MHALNKFNKHYDEMKPTKVVKIARQGSQLVCGNLRKNIVSLRSLLLVFVYKFCEKKDKEPSIKCVSNKEERGVENSSKNIKTSRERIVKNCPHWGGGRHKQGKICWYILWIAPNIYYWGSWSYLHNTSNVFTELGVLHAAVYCGRVAGRVVHK